MSTERAEEEKQKSKGVRIHQRGTFPEQKVRSDACFVHALHNAYIQTHGSSHELILGVRVCKHKCGSVSVKRDDLLLNPAIIYSMAPKHVLGLLLKGPQLVSIVTIHTETVSKRSILT